MIENTDLATHTWLLGFAHPTLENLNAGQYDKGDMMQTWINFYNEHCASFGTQGFIRMKPSKPREATDHDAHVLQSVLLVPTSASASIEESLETAFGSGFRTIVLNLESHPETEAYMEEHISGPHWEIINSVDAGHNTQPQTQAHLHTSL